MALRKKTGYSYANCRKALVKFGENNMAEAEKWLRQEAAKEGWAKAAKLGARQTAQGLMSVLAHGDYAAVVELKCETDFVARSDPFKELLEELTVAIADTATKATKRASQSGGFTIADVDTASTKTRKGRTVAEAVAMTVGKLGENITIGRAQLILPKQGVKLFGQAHPQEGTESIHMGRFVSVLGIQREAATTAFPTEKLAAQLCHHIIGMCPEKVGTPRDASADAEAEKKKAAEGAADEDEDDLNAFSRVDVTRIDENETELLRQPFMLNPTQTVHDYLQSHGANVSQFVRLELGAEASQ
ncbi:Elongation factor TS family protein [Aphelenchoides avenae]|nr:Elongation factor TS family protein [Aphelenchus avenae]